MNPTEPLPILIRAAFILDIMAATDGADADVPEESFCIVAILFR